VPPGVVLMVLVNEHPLSNTEGLAATRPSVNITRTFRAMPILTARRTVTPEVPPRSPRDRWDVVIQLARATTAVAIMVTTLIQLF
jgi:hypothetical protein